MKLRVLGVDPGSKATGLAILETSESYGEIKILSTKQVEVYHIDGFTGRLKLLLDETDEYVQKWHPTHAAVESPFTGPNKHTGLQIAQTRGVLMATILRSIDHENLKNYAATSARKLAVGSGKLKKQEVREKLMEITDNIDAFMRRSDDEIDAVAVALAMHVDLLGGSGVADEDDCYKLVLNHS